MQNPKNILTLLHAVERLKDECRHSWTSQGRRESVAEHSWRLSFLLMVCAPYLSKKIDLLKALKMALLHDIGEAKIGDKHYLEIIATNQSKEERFQQESRAVRELASLLGENASSIIELWTEFEENETHEAKIIRALDMLEALIQHNEADISTWTEEEISSIEKNYNDIESDDEFILNLKEIIKNETLTKLQLFFTEK